MSINTFSKGFIPLLPQDDTEWVFLLDWLEMAMSKQQLTEITALWNDGMELEQIAEEVSRNKFNPGLSRYWRSLLNDCFKGW